MEADGGMDEERQSQNQGRAPPETWDGQIKDSLTNTDEFLISERISPPCWSAMGPCVTVQRKKLRSRNTPSHYCCICL